jgi:hypothetical protein
MGQFFISLKLNILMISEASKLMESKRLWPYYTNVYHKYIHRSFNIDNEIYYHLKNNTSLH